MDYTHILKRLPPYRDTSAPTPGVYTAIPQGRKALAWFTYHRAKNICFIVDLKTKKITPTHAAFSSSLSLGTLLTGTIVQDQTRQFIADGIHWLKGVPVENKMEALAAAVAETSPTLFLPTQLLFSLPVSSYNPFVVTPYPQQHLRVGAACHPANKTEVFPVTATDKCDIYELNGNVAGVDTLERSSYLKNLFHTCPTIPMVCQWHPTFKKWVPIRPA
jgi:hypothetical protein